MNINSELQDGLPYLLLFPLNRSFEELSVYEYRIEASDAFEEDPMDATYSLVNYLRASSNAAVTMQESCLLLRLISYV